MEVISIGKRLRGIRKTLGIRQDEITGDLVTRNLISIIENDKASLTPKVAQMVVYQINQICLARGIDYRITIEELLESEASQIEKNTYNLIENINKGEYNLNDERNKLCVLELENSLVMNGAYMVAFALNVACEEYFSLKNLYFEAYYYCKRAVNLATPLIGNERVLKEYINISYYLILLERFKEAIYYCDLTMEKFSEISPSYRYMVLMNKNIAANRMGDRNLSSEIIESMLDIEGLKSIDYNKALISKANRLAEDGNFNESIEIYESIYSELTSSPQKYLVLSNMIDIYISIDDQDKLKKIMNQSLTALEKDGIELKSGYQGKILFKLSKGYLHLEQNELFLFYSEKAQNCCREEKQYSGLKAVIDFKLDYLMTHENIGFLNEMVSFVCSAADESILRREDDCVWRLMGHLAKINDLGNVQRMVDCFASVDVRS